MDFLFEHPWWLMSISVGLELFLAILLLVSRRGILLWWMLGVCVVGLLGLLVERLVVTDRELIENTLYSTAEAVQANDPNRTLGFFLPDALQARRDIAWILDRFEIQKAEIYDLKITIDRGKKPLTAQAVFLGHAFYRDRQGEVPYTNYGRYLIVDLRKEGKKWLLDRIEAKNQAGSPGPFNNNIRL